MEKNGSEQFKINKMHTVFRVASIQYLLMFSPYAFT